jgi:protein-disulfide isomerase-like protein with CxxC motif
MKRELFADRETAERIGRDFIPVRVVDRTREETRNPPDTAELQHRYGVSSFPSLVVVGAGTEPSILRGYGGRTATTDFLTKALREHGSPRPRSAGP